MGPGAPLWMRKPPMAPVWPSPRRGTGEKKTSMEKKKERRKDWIWIKGIWGDGRSLFFIFLPSPADSAPELLKPRSSRKELLYGGSPPSADSPTGRLAVKQGEAVGPQGHGWHVSMLGARLEVHCLGQQDQVLSLQKLSTNSAVILLRTVTASKLNCPGAELTHWKRL